MANESLWLSTIVVFVALATRSFTESASVNLSEIHHHMTEDELLSVFKVPDVESVPDYEIATVTRAKHRSRRSIRGRDRQTYYMNSGKTVLALKPADSLLVGANTPIYLASSDRSQPNGIRYTRKKWPSNMALYRDDRNQAVVSRSIVANAKNRRASFEGIIGNDYVIKPVPGRFLDDEDDSHHLIYKRQINRNVASSGSADYLRANYRISMAHQYSSDVDVVYPEVLVIVDHSTYLAHGSNLQRLCKYMATFWHAVDSRYRVLRQPQVRLNIAALIVSTDSYGAPYIARNNNGRYAYPGSIINDLAHYLPREKRVGAFDLPVAITNLDLCDRNGYGGCNSNVVGMATIGGACWHGVGAGVFEDHVDWSGVNTVAHELAHMFDSQHDGEGNYCSANDGYLMAPSQSWSSNGKRWSQCSLAQMQHFFRTNGGCLRNKPQVIGHRPNIDIDEEPDNYDDYQEPDNYDDDQEPDNDDEYQEPNNDDEYRPTYYTNYPPRQYQPPGCCRCCKC